MKKIAKGIEKMVVLTVKETAEYLSCTPQMIYNMVTEKTLKAFRIGNRLRIKQSDINCYIETHST